ncbi:uncharacterized protein P174DRAFT_419124 [Aspergillus novofumigatus IBT 16806]|uniref:Ankyrin repeat protein n=1 Tax=Aspergillus novofumigatus (strain IBT 16806) TaxID=1392255 RepID=A0A2I1CC45_ASPN1|nr:uncharacterized protein P174DRAFT_419124 [Aspergillus novofumigatus IBT 16806]PKX95166.1 hypothetical protein P174DRAFT_419124 [Aspergillus novofumigatus IBT 16806]
MGPDNAFLDAFLHACCEGELLKTQEAIASGRLTPDDLNLNGRLPPREDRRQHPSVIRHFLHHGLDPNTSLSSGEPLLSLLTDPACARELLSRGADPNHSDPGGGVPPLIRAIVGTREEDTSLPELLLAHEAKLDSDNICCRGSACAPTRAHD